MSPPPSPGPEARKPFGILFVHGIGEQKRGETLQNAADPLIEWLGRCLDSRGGAVDAPAAWLATPSSDPHAPAHARLLTRAAPDAPTCSVLLAESWWAEEFPVPSFPEIRRWLLRSASWVVIGHFVRRVYLRWMVPLLEVLRLVTFPFRILGGPTHEWGLYFLVAAFFALVTIPFVFFVQAGAGLLSLLSFIPLAGIDAWVSGLTRKLASVVGDSYVFTHRRLARSAVVHRVSHDLAWLSQQCEKVAVVSHSQGAAVCFQALERSAPSNLALWITYGAGIRKLLELEQFRLLAGYVRYAWAFVLAAACAAPIVVPAVRQSWLPALSTPWHICAWLAIGLYAGVFIPLVIVHSSRAIRAAQAELETRCAALAARGFAWLDLWASQDPVPAGKLLDPGGSEFGLKHTLSRLFLWALDLRKVDPAEAVRRLDDLIRDAQVRRSRAIEFLQSAKLDPLEFFRFLRQNLLRRQLPGPVSRFVRNRLSPLLDHVTYWDNFDDFIPRAAAALSAAGGLGWPVEEAWIKARARARGFRLYQYWTGRLLVFSACAAACWTQRWLLFGVSSFYLEDRFAHLLPDFLNTLGRDFRHGLSWLAAALAGFLAAFLYHALFPAAIWSAWDQGVYTRLFATSPRPWPARLWSVAYWFSALAPWALCVYFLIRTGYLRLFWS